MGRTINEQDEIRLTDAFARLRQIESPPVDPDRERALLAAFDEHWAAGRLAPRAARTKATRWTFGAAAVLATLVLALNWTAATMRPSGDGAPAASFDMEGFMLWPGADAWPPFESGSIVRVELPVTVLSSLGLTAPAPAATLVQADIIVGQDGLTRAVRIVQ